MATTAPDQAEALDVREQIVRIDKTQAEMQKLLAEAAQVRLDTRLLPFSTIAAVAGGGAALFAAGVTFIKLLG